MTKPHETEELRPRPHIGTRGIHSTYDPQPPKVTTGLPIGTQAMFLVGAEAAAGWGMPLNTLLTIRLDCFSISDRPGLRISKNPAKLVGRLVELLRKWMKRRLGSQFIYIWVREDSSDQGEHWHLALYLPRQLEKAFAEYIAKVMGEPMLPRRRPLCDRTEGEWACGQLGSWHLARDTRPERNGYMLAAYLGKAEPSQRLFRGKIIVNERKPVRGGKYDLEQGLILGTAARKKRYDIARPLKNVATQSGVGARKPAGRRRCFQTSP